MIKKYRKSGILEAMLHDGSDDSCAAIIKWVTGRDGRVAWAVRKDAAGRSEIHFPSLGNTGMRVYPGDYLIWRHRIFYLLPSETFKNLYEPVPDEEESTEYRLLPINPTPEMLNALRTGSRRDYPSDELCAVRYAAMLAAAPPPDRSPDNP